MTTPPEKERVSAALSELDQTIAEEKERLNEKAAQAMKDGEYDAATAVIQFTKRLLGFQSEVEALIGKWEELGGIGDQATPQVRQVARTFVVQGKAPGRLPRTQRTSYEGSTEATAHCFHILDVLEGMGGLAKNQDVSAAVNKRIKMLYPKFKEARILLAQKGWTQRTGSSHALQISERGILWLNKQKGQLTDDGYSKSISPISKHDHGVAPSVSRLPEISAQEISVPGFDYEDSDQI